MNEEKSAKQSPGKAGVRHKIIQAALKIDENSSPNERENIIPLNWLCYGCS